MSVEVSQAEWEQRKSSLKELPHNQNETQKYNELYLVVKNTQIHLKEKWMKYRPSTYQTSETL